jgi:hypothetical protein
MGVVFKIVLPVTAFIIFAQYCHFKGAVTQSLMWCDSSLRETKVTVQQFREIETTQTIYIHFD